MGRSPSHPGVPSRLQDPYPDDISPTQYLPSLAIDSVAVTLTVTALISNCSRVTQDLRVISDYILTLLPEDLHITGPKLLRISGREFCEGS